MTRNCLLTAWRAHELELRNYLRRHMASTCDADDLLQEVFLKALAQGAKFCAVENARAWLFQVARNTLTDHQRRARHQIELPEDIPERISLPAPVETLSECLPRALSELSPDDREAILRCDIEGMSQADYARLKAISLPGAKSRVQRARKRLREHLQTVCQVRFDEAGQVCCFVPRG